MFMSNFQVLNIREWGRYGKILTEDLVYWPSDSEANTAGRGLRFSRDDRTVEVIKLFIIWLYYYSCLFYGFYEKLLATHN